MVMVTPLSGLIKMRSSWFHCHLSQTPWWPSESSKRSSPPVVLFDAVGRGWSATQCYQRGRRRNQPFGRFSYLVPGRELGNCCRASSVINKSENCSFATTTSSTVFFAMSGASPSVRQVLVLSSINWHSKVASQDSAGLLYLPASPALSMRNNFERRRRRYYIDNHHLCWESVAHRSRRSRATGWWWCICIGDLRCRALFSPQGLILVRGWLCGSRPERFSSTTGSLHHLWFIGNGKQSLLSTDVTVCVGGRWSVELECWGICN